MNWSFKLVRKNVVDPALARDPTQILKRVRDNGNPEVGLTFRSRTHMPGVQMRFINHLQMGGRQLRR